MKKNIVSGNIKQTKKIAKDFAEKLRCPKQACLPARQGLGQGATVIGLSGELGSGKTTFAQSFAKAIGIKERVISPTFMIMKKFQIPKIKSQANFKNQTKSFKTLIHIDAYRIKEAGEMLDLGWREMIENPENIILVEWPENIKKIFPKNYFLLKFGHVDEKKRAIDISFIN